MAREVRRQTLRWKKEHTPIPSQEGKKGQTERSYKTVLSVGAYCRLQMAIIDMSTCIVMQARKVNNCIGCRHYGG